MPRFVVAVPCGEMYCTSHTRVPVLYLYFFLNLVMLYLNDYPFLGRCGCALLRRSENLKGSVVTV